MKLYLFNQKLRFGAHLRQMQALTVIPYDRSRLKETVSEIAVHAPFPKDKFPGCITEYHIFPEDILAAFREYERDNRPMQPGDTIVQQVYLPPLPACSIKAVMGVRITEVIEEPQRIGFSYETLEGHAEKGVSTFIIEKSAQGMVFRIHTFSEPGNPLLRWFSQPYQSFCTKRALRHVKRQLEFADINTSD